MQSLQDNPGYTTPESLSREIVNANAGWLAEIANVTANYTWQEKYDSLLVLYRDTLAGQGFERELLQVYMSVDSLQWARSYLDTMTLVGADDSLFANYLDLSLTLKEDTLTWQELDSVQVQKLTVLSQVPLGEFCYGGKGFARPHYLLPPSGSGY